MNESRPNSTQEQLVAECIKIINDSVRGTSGHQRLGIKRGQNGENRENETNNNMTPSKDK